MFFSFLCRFCQLRAITRRDKMIALSLSQTGITCSYLTNEALEKGVKYVQS